MRVRSLRMRLLLVSIGLAASVLVLGVVMFNVALRADLISDADREVESRVADALDLVEVGPDGVRLVDSGAGAAPSNRGVWVFAGPELLFAPDALADLTPSVVAAADGARGFRTIDDPPARLLVVPISRSDTRVGTLVGAVRLNTYERSVRSALIGSLVLGLAMLAALSLLTWWALGSALRPVSRMTELAARWSDESPDERFELEHGRDELSRLGATLNGLLDRASAGVRRERRLSAEIAHELRTPLSRVAAEAELALAGDGKADPATRAALEAIRDATLGLARTIDALVMTAEGGDPAARGTCTAREAVADAVAAVRPAGEEGQLLVDVSRVGDDRIGVDADVVSQILRPVLENALRYARSRVVITARRDGPVIELVVDDDGPGLSPEEGEVIFEPGRRGSAAAQGIVPGAGLGLALSRRLAGGVDGEVCADGDAPGGRFVIRLPAG